MKRFGIIGAGLIGSKRAAHLAGAKLVAVHDVVQERARQLARQHGAEVEERWENLIRRRDIDGIVVSTPNESISVCAVAALEFGKHVLVEKPAGRNAGDIQRIIAAAQKARKVAGVGFNHRFHPAFQNAKRQLEAGEFGPLMYIRARYGHGGRVGYDREWRADPKISGGGELLDQGIHLIDLCRWLGGEFQLKWGTARTFFWDMPVEDNGFLLLSSPDEQRLAFLHASCTEWKNLFDFEIFGKTGKMEVWGLGRSYGVEELRTYRMKPEMGPPEMAITKFPEEDASWQSEFDALLGEIDGRRTHLATLDDALHAMEIVQAVYDKPQPTLSKAPTCNA